MFIVHKKGLVLNGKNPTYLYAYGGFNVSLTPGFQRGAHAVAGKWRRVWPCLTCAAAASTAKTGTKPA